MDGVLHTGDVLVYVDNECMLGASQDDACRIFRSIPVGETVTIQVCRGYPLMLDPTNRVSFVDTIRFCEQRTRFNVLVSDNNRECLHVNELPFEVEGNHRD